jgi:hypothetical protein
MTGLQIRNARVKRHVLDVAIGEAAAALVISEHHVPVGQCLEPVPPYGTLPVELQVGEPRGRPDQRAASPVDRVGQASAISGAAESDFLSHGPPAPERRLS